MSESELDRDGAGSIGPGNASAKQRALAAYLNALPTAQREATLRLMQDLNADAEAADVVNIVMNAYVLAATAEQLTQMTFQLDKLARRPPLQPDLSELKTAISQLRPTPSSPQANPIRLQSSASILWAVATALLATGLGIGGYYFGSIASTHQSACVAAEKFELQLLTEARHERSATAANFLSKGWTPKNC